MPVLEVNGISKTFNKRIVLSKVSFVINEGEIIGFVGPNGAGKSTAMKIIAGLLFPSEGSVTICGYDLRKQREKAIDRLAAVIENPSLYDYLSAYENLDFVRGVNGVSKSELDGIIQLVGLKDRIHDTVRKYSLGMKQRLAIAMALLSKPSVLLLDEPTNGLDPSVKAELRKIYQELACKNKIGILISSHDLSEIQKICSKVVFIRDGVIINTTNISDTEDQRIKIAVSDTEKAKALAQSCAYVKNSEIADKSIIVTISRDALGSLLKVFISGGIDFGSPETCDDVVENCYSNLYGECDENAKSSDI